MHMCTGKVVHLCTVFMHRNSGEIGAGTYQARIYLEYTTITYTVPTALAVVLT
jgi:hypothetical protein